MRYYEPPQASTSNTGGTVAGLADTGVCAAVEPDRQGPGETSMRIATSLTLSITSLLLFAALWTVDCPIWLERIGFSCCLAMSLSYFVLSPAPFRHSEGQSLTVGNAAKVQARARWPLTLLVGRAGEADSSGNLLP